MTFTPVLPAVSELDRALTGTQEALSLARSTTDLAGPGARAFGRLSIRVYSTRAVEALAAAWGTRAEWRDGGTQYTAVTGDSYAEVEAVFYRDAPASAGNRAAA